MNCIHEQTWIPEAASGSWLHEATAGRTIEYHRDLLGFDTAEPTTPLSTDELRQRIATATMAYRADEEGAGPRYLKVGGRIVYRLEDIEEFEAKQIHDAGSR